MTDETSDRATTDERREAEALAHALERGSATEELPEDALETAALLRYSAGGSELRADREESVLAEVLEAAARINARRASAEPAARAPSALWRWLFGLGGATAFAALLFFLVIRGGSSPGDVSPTELPAPSPALLSSGLDRISDDSGAESPAFRAALGDYRDAVYGAIAQRYR